ncbi:MAG: SDR family oxidoreductase [Lachnospiraceae bacterium]|nr:SDR family oxidoreductase [Lachnospiraceae bacterium]
MSKNILITGASSDVGIAFLKEENPAWDTAFLQYRTMSPALEEAADRLKKIKNVHLMQADFEDAESIKKMISEIKETGETPNQILHLPAPKAHNLQFRKETVTAFRQGFEIGVESAVRILQAFLPGMSKAGYGRVVFMLSSYTQGIPPKNQSAYVTNKYALLGLMKALSAEYAEHGITVNGISPEMMETKFLSDVPEMIVEMNASSLPIGRNVRVEEVLPVLNYLLSDEAAAMTGQNIVISGGKS